MTVARPLLFLDELEMSISNYGKEISILRGINIELRKGKSLGIVGESGSGKTMTARTIMRLLPATASIGNGHIFFSGDDIVQWPEAKLQREYRGRKVSIIFQHARESLNPLFSVGQQIADVYLRHRGGTRKEAAAAAVEMLEKVSMPNPTQNTRSYPHELSGGMCQRAIIAMALICLPDLLIADEPTTGLDMTIQAQVLELIVDVVEQMQSNLMFISHDIGVISETCHEVAVMYCGRVVETLPVDKLFHQARHPYTNGLIRSYDTGSEKRLNFIPGTSPDLESEIKGCDFAPRCEYAKDICFHERPLMRKIGADHFVACHLA